MKLKKAAVTLLAAMVASATLIGCGSNEKPAETTTAPATESTGTETTQAAPVSAGEQTPRVLTFASQ